MAYVHFPKLIFALFLVTSTLSIAYSARSANLILPTRIDGVDIFGRLVCSSTGNVLPGTNSPGIAGVDVNITCNGGQFNLGTLTTNATGFFTGLRKIFDGITLDPSDCVAQVKLPIVSCTAFPPTGVIRSALGFGGIVDTLFGIVAILVTETWQIIP